MMTTDQRAELDAVMARATAEPWGADGLRDNRIVWSGPENRVCFMAIYPKAHADSLAIVSLHNAYPTLTATIDAQAERIAELEAENARLREALGAIGAGSWQGITPLVLAGEWQAVFTRAQCIARAALKDTAQ